MNVDPGDARRYPGPDKEQQMRGNEIRPLPTDETKSYICNCDLS